MQEIKQTFNHYKINQEMASRDQKDNIAKVVEKTKIFAAQIELIASLLKADYKSRQ